MILHHALPSSIIDLGPPPSVSSTTERAMDRIWQRDLAEPGRILYNGTLFSIASIEGDRISGHFVEYRRFYAQYREPNLFEELRVRPLGVTGLLRAPEGFVFGCRGKGVAQDAGVWELAPAGGVDREAMMEGVIDPITQLFLELREELGIEAPRISRAEPFCFLEDTESHVIDIGIALDTDFPAALLHPSAEYSRVEAVAPPDLATFVTSCGPRLSAISRVLLAERGLL